MAIYIAQHGKSLPATEDPEKGLTGVGMEETRRIAGVAKGYGVTVERIVHSGKKRARQTAEIFAEVLSPANGLDTRSDMNPMDDVHPFIGRLDDIGHNGMELVAELLEITGNYGFSTEVIVASIRHPGHVKEAALLGADIATIPFAVLEKLFKHTLTDVGIQRFLADWEKVPDKSF